VLLAFIFVFDRFDRDQISFYLYQKSSDESWKH